MSRKPRTIKYKHFIYWKIKMKYKLHYTKTIKSWSTMIDHGDSQQTQPHWLPQQASLFDWHLATLDKVERSPKIDCYMIFSTWKASAIKNAILVFAFWHGPTTDFPWKFHGIVTESTDPRRNQGSSFSRFPNPDQHEHLRPPWGVREAHLGHACKPCFIAEIPLQTCGNK